MVQLTAPLLASRGCPCAPWPRRCQWAALPWSPQPLSVANCSQLFIEVVLGRSSKWFSEFVCLKGVLGKEEQAPPCQLGLRRWRSFPVGARAKLRTRGVPTVCRLQLVKECVASTLDMLSTGGCALNAYIHRKLVFVNAAFNAALSWGVFAVPRVLVCLFSRRGLGCFASLRFGVFVVPTHPMRLQSQPSIARWRLRCPPGRVLLWRRVLGAELPTLPPFRGSKLPSGLWCSSSPCARSDCTVNHC